MTHDEVMEMIGKMGLPFAYDHFMEGESPDPPFVVFLYPNSSHFAADGREYFKASRLNIELYTDIKDVGLEERVEDILDGCGIFYEKNEVWIESEKLYEVLYEMEV